MRLVGHKTTAMFDIWSVEHWVTGMCIGAAMHLAVRRKMPALDAVTYYALVAMVAFAWEVIEHYLETGLAGQAVAYWFQGVEHWSNRMVSDPLLVLLGACLVRRCPKLTVPARLFSLAWLGVHVFVFEHSMVLQERIVSWAH